MREALFVCFLIACRATPTATPAAEFSVAAIVAPEGWSVTHDGARATFVDPERAMRVVIAESDREMKDAIAREWNALQPDVLTVKSEFDEPPPDGGWDQHVIVEYSVREGRTASAEWLRLGARGYVILVEGDANAVTKREAQIAKLVDAIKPRDLHEEVFGATHEVDRAELDAFVDRAMSALDVPGTAILIAREGKIVYSRTAGVKEKGTRDPITPNTRFLMASVTKPMTTMMTAALVDKKLVQWHQHVTEILPTFALADADTTKQLELWHMTCACTGMPRQDMEGLFEWNGVTAEARIAVMKTMKPTTKIGETFQYSNPMVAAGGFIAAHAFAPQQPLGDAYASAMDAMVFAPIGMTSTTFDAAKVASGDHAMPHALSISGETRVMPLSIERGVEPIAPAGGAWSTAGDMMKYALTEMNEGVTPEGTRVVSVENYRERTKPRIAMGDGESYALGMDVSTYRGQRVLHHSGGSMGFGTRIVIMPDAKVAIVILTNVRNGNAKEQLPFVEAVTRKAYEALFTGAKPLAEKQLAYFVTLRHRDPYTPNTDRSWVARLVGNYHEPLLGDVAIKETANGVIFDAGEWQSAIDVMTGPDGTQRIVMLDPPFAGPGVMVGPGDPPTLIVPDQTTYTFTRVR